MKRKRKKGSAPTKPAHARVVREAAIIPVADEDTARLFWNGRSQAVRLPKEYRFEGDEVRIRREGERVILEPLRPKAWPPGFFERLGTVDEEFERLVRENRLNDELRIHDFGGEA